MLLCILSGLSPCLPHIHVDFVGPLYPPSRLTGHNLIFTVIDGFSKWIELYPCSDQTAETAALCLKKWCCRYGFPLDITSDRGAAFVSELFGAFLKLWKIAPHLTSSYHAAANAKVERMHAVMEAMLRSFVDDHPDDWEEALDEVQLAFRDAAFDPSGPPSEIVFGQSLRTPWDCDMDRLMENRNELDEASMDWLHERYLLMQKAREAVTLRIKEYQDKYAASIQPGSSRCSLCERRLRDEERPEPSR